MYNAYVIPHHEQTTIYTERMQMLKEFTFKTKKSEHNAPFVFVHQHNIEDDSGRFWWVVRGFIPIIESDYSIVNIYPLLDISYRRFLSST